MARAVGVFRDQKSAGIQLAGQGEIERQRSTQEIARHLGEVRAATAASVIAVGRIEQNIGEIDAIAGSIAAAVEEQGAATSGKWPMPPFALDEATAASLHTMLERPEHRPAA
jgi:methyl-accepting chemotaxis protein